MLPARFLSFTLNTSNSANNSQCFSSFQGHLSKDNANCYGSTGPPLQRAMSGWSEANSDEFVVSPAHSRDQLPTMQVQADSESSSETIRRTASFADKSNDNPEHLHLIPAKTTLKSSTMRLAFDLTSTTSPELAGSDLVAQKLLVTEEPKRTELKYPAHNMRMFNEPMHYRPDDLEAFSKMSHEVCKCCSDRLTKNTEDAKIGSHIRAKRLHSLRPDCVIGRTFNIEKEPIRLLVQKYPSQLPKPTVANSGKKRQVYVCVIFLKIGEIDTIKEQYAADVLIKSKWREPEMDHRNDKLVRLMHIDNSPVTIFKSIDKFEWFEPIF
ncbi:hypothetical protein Ciccas_012951 [Cichlidogyrus casuarinus]|uniref:Uncharacterized protein n=1 Tax=Cichlidogyrus casuarinus TaxID=1844966 RepID=A0ABD2PPA2_9PLAT